MAAPSREHENDAPAPGPGEHDQPAEGGREAVERQLERDAEPSGAEEDR